MKIGNYSVEFPIVIDGHTSTNTGRIVSTGKTKYPSQTFTLYGSGRVGFDQPEQVTDAVRKAVKMLKPTATRPRKGRR